MTHHPPTASPLFTPPPWAVVLAQSLPRTPIQSEPMPHFHTGGGAAQRLSQYRCGTVAVLPHLRCKDVASPSTGSGPPAMRPHKIQQFASLSAKPLAPESQPETCVHPCFASVRIRFDCEPYACQTSPAAGVYAIRGTSGSGHWSTVRPTLRRRPSPPA